MMKNGRASINEEPSNLQALVTKSSIHKVAKTFWFIVEE